MLSQYSILRAIFRTQNSRHLDVTLSRSLEGFLDLSQGALTNQTVEKETDHTVGLEPVPRYFSFQPLQSPEAGSGQNSWFTFVRNDFEVIGGLSDFPPPMLPVVSGTSAAVENNNDCWLSCMFSFAGNAMFQPTQDVGSLLSSQQVQSLQAPPPHAGEKLASTIAAVQAKRKSPSGTLTLVFAARSVARTVSKLGGFDAICESEHREYADKMKVKSEEENCPVNNCADRGRKDNVLRHRALVHK
ncbi:hypothetical protein QBC35DRAFT_554490 [Podospora australis]|uniref:Uncharacterized protein n=1 Tax=Podospora australis TaxID=1536484 RepID=A0AAN7AHK9_9PEZI|nr:hypothetical protein QBC35DRAFT_554490 [Podospora australis]